MKNVTKRILSALITLIMVLTIIPISGMTFASAANEKTVTAQFITDNDGKYMETLYITFSCTERKATSAKINIKWKYTIDAGKWDLYRYDFVVKCGKVSTGRKTCVPSNSWPNNSSANEERSKSISTDITVPISTTNETTVDLVCIQYKCNINGTILYTESKKPGTVSFTIPKYASAYTLSYDANGGTGAPANQTGASSYVVSSQKPTRNGYTFQGWSTSSTATTATYSSGSNISLTGNTTLYAVWKQNSATSYTVSYNANGGSVTPTSASVTAGNSTTLPTPTKKYTISYNANNGSGAPSTQNVAVTCKGWATSSSATSATYSCGSSYKPTANTTLYAVWNSSANGTVSSTKPTRSGYTFQGWSTSSTATTATYSSGSNISLTGNTTLYAVWNSSNIYNLGEETYSFENFGDSDSEGGHCFGMSITSSGYYNGYLDVSTLGINSCQKLYTLNRISKVTKNICNYQRKQGRYAKNSIVAGGSYQKNNYELSYCNALADWNSMVSYVKNHNYDNSGALQLLFWGYYKYSGCNYFGGHAVNFLYYKVVNGQERIYAYDNNFPNTEVYFYKASNGKIYESPYETFDVSIDSLSFNSIQTYFSLVSSYNSCYYIYAKDGEIKVDGATCYPMMTELNGVRYVMYEIPESKTSVSITPLVSNATFEYNDNEFSFKNDIKNSVGVLTLANSSESSQTASFVVVSKTNKVNSVQVDNISLNYKKSTTLTPKIDADSGVTYTVEYESSNPKVATVDENGKVTATKRGSGSATITCTVTDQYGNTVTDDCKVNVSLSFGQKLLVYVLFGWLWY